MSLRDTASLDYDFEKKSEPIEAHNQNQGRQNLLAKVEDDE
jgi:hypothetical protein